MFDKKQKRCVKRIHLVTDDGLYEQKAFYSVKKFFLFILYKGWRIYQLSTFSNYGHFQKLQPSDLNIYTETALKTYTFEALINQKYWAKGEKRTCEMIETLKTLKEERGS